MCLFVLARRIYCVCTYLQPYLLDMLRVAVGVRRLPNAKVEFNKEAKNMKPTVKSQDTRVIAVRAPCNGACKRRSTSSTKH